MKTSHTDPFLFYAWAISFLAINTYDYISCYRRVMQSFFKVSYKKYDKGSTTSSNPSYLGILGWLAVNLMGNGGSLVHFCFLNFTQRSLYLLKYESFNSPRSSILKFPPTPLRLLLVSTLTEAQTAANNTKKWRLQSCCTGRDALPRRYWSFTRGDTFKYTICFPSFVSLSLFSMPHLNAVPPSRLFPQYVLLHMQLTDSS